MDALQARSVEFEVCMVDRPADLARFIPTLQANEAMAQNSLKNLSKDLVSGNAVDLSAVSHQLSPIQSIYNTAFNSSATFTTIIETVKNKIIDGHYPDLHLADRFIVVVSWDCVSWLPQAFAILASKADSFREAATIEVQGLATAFRNLPFPENESAEHRVKGAGASIIKFCKALGIREKAKYLHLEAAPGAIGFYEKYGFMRANPVAPDAPTIPDPFGMKRTSMYFDLES